jgi:hypothetical protein
MMKEAGLFTTLRGGKWKEAEQAGKPPRSPGGIPALAGGVACPTGTGRVHEFLLFLYLSQQN